MDFDFDFGGVWQCVLRFVVWFCLLVLVVVVFCLVEFVSLYLCFVFRLLGCWWWVGCLGLFVFVVVCFWFVCVYTVFKV